MACQLLTNIYIYMISLTHANINGLSYGLPQLPFRHKYGPIPVLGGPDTDHSCFYCHTSTAANLMEFFFQYDTVYIHLFPAFFEKTLYDSSLGDMVSFYNRFEYFQVIYGTVYSANCFLCDVMGDGLVISSNGNSSRVLLSPYTDMQTWRPRSDTYRRTEYTFALKPGEFSGIPETIPGGIQTIEAPGASLNIASQYPLVNCWNPEQGIVDHELSTTKAYPWRDYVMSFPYTD